MERKIILCTTFREFDESVNSKIQMLFLNSIKNQNYKNYLLVITTFGEKTVRETIKEMFPDNSCIMEETLEEYRYSLSAVVLNALKVAKGFEDSILLWSTCDIIFDKNYLAKINSHYSRDMVGTTHPNIITNSLDELKKRNFSFQNLDRGFDILFFSTAGLAAREQILSDYYFYEWGVFEHFLIGIALMYSKNMLNFINYANIIKIENDRNASKEPNEFLKECHKRNWALLEKCISETQMNSNVKNLRYCHYKFKILRRNLRFSLYETKQVTLLITQKIKSKFTILRK